MALTIIERNVQLDLYDHDLTPSKIKAIALDSKTRYVGAEIHNGGQTYDVGQNTGVTLTIIRPDKTGVQVTGETFQYTVGEGETVYGAYAELTQTALAVSGTLQAQFMLTSGDQILRTEIFTINNGVALDATVSEWAGEYQGYNLDELVQDVSDLKEGLNALPQSLGTLDEDADLYLSDENGNALVAFADGHVKTKNFDSEDISERVATLEDAEEQSYIPDIMETDAVVADLDVTDSHGNVVARFAQGHIRTKNFDSAEAMERISDAEDDISDANKEIKFMRRVRTRMCFGAHNGAEYYAPECTIPAYRIAGQQGWEWAWIAGIYFSSEGSMYVLHDGTVDRTTDGTGSISSMTDAQIDALNITQTGSGYNLSDFDPSELKIPTFEQVLQQCVRYGMKMVIRLHSFPGYSSDADKAVWSSFYDLLKGYNVKADDISCYVGTGGMATICRNLFGDNVEISTFLGQAATAQDFIDWFAEKSIGGNRAAILSIQNTNLSAVKLLHQNGIRVYTYNSATEADASSCATMGVDIYQNSKIYKLTE